MRSIPSAEYAFHHPLIRAVAYESQLRSDRAQLHRRLAAAIEASSPESADQNAALIAEHLEAAGDARPAYGWHMRAAAGRPTATSARRGSVGNGPAKSPTRYPTTTRTAPRCVSRPAPCSAAPAGESMRTSPATFEELRELCAHAGDKASLALGMTGMVMDHMMQGRLREASQLASEQMTLLESIGDPALTVGAGFMAILMKYRAGEIADILRWSQTVIDWADGDPTKGNLVVGSPLAVALVWRGVARFWLGRDGWRQDLDDAVAMARNSDLATHALVVLWKYGFGITNGVLLADDTALRELEEALQVAERSGDDTALGLAKYVTGYRAVTAGRRSGPSARNGAAGAGPRHVPARAVLRSELPGLEAV